MKGEIHVDRSIADLVERMLKDAVGTLRVVRDKWDVKINNNKMAGNKMVVYKSDIIDW